MAIDNIRVKELMSTNLKTLHPKDKVLRAKEIFDQYDIHHIPVAVMGEVRGIISVGDLLFLEGIVSHSFDEFLRTKKYQMSTVDEIMTPRPHTIHQENTIVDAIDLMTDKRVNCLPVMNEGSLVGILTNQDLISFFRTKIKS